MKNLFDQAVEEATSVMHEWLDSDWDDIVATKIVERLIAKGIIQSTDMNELVPSDKREMVVPKLVIGASSKRPIY